nr:VanZ family protein [Cryobacterium mannosilyticum]
MHRWTFWLTAAYLVALILIAFWPTPVDRSAHHDILGVLRWLQLHGAPPWLRYDVVEFSANIALFAPVGVFVVILAGARRWWLALLTGLAASCAIELGQLLFLPDRFATVADVVANTAGAAVGTSLGPLLLALAPSLSGRTGRTPSPRPATVQQGPSTPPYPEEDFDREAPNPMSASRLSRRRQAPREH